MTRIPVPPPTEPAIDKNTGQWTQPWYQFLSQAPDVPTGFFQVDLNSSNQSVSASVTTQQVLFNHASVNPDLWFDTTTSTYTPKEPGYYFFAAFVNSPNSTAGHTNQVGIYLNDSLRARGNYISAVSTAAENSGTVSDILLLNGSSDTVKFCVFAGSTTVFGGAVDTYAYGFKIGST